MTKRERQLAIAEACGFEEIQSFGKISVGIAKGAPNHQPLVLPDYLHDLNAMHEAEKTLSEKQVVFYLTKLLQVRYRTGADHGMIACMQDKLAFATAPQRAEAFLRTIGKWVE